MREFIEGSDSGVYIVPANQLPQDAWFVRDPKLSKDGDLGPLLHICEKELDEGQHVPAYIILTGKVWWDFGQGHYICRECKKTWGKNDTDGLRAIWSDGYGTGDEGHA